MAKNRLEGLAMISIEHEISQNIDPADLTSDFADPTSDFANMKARKVSLRAVDISHNINQKNVKKSAKHIMCVVYLVFVAQQ